MKLILTIRSITLLLMVCLASNLAAEEVILFSVKIYDIDGLNSSELAMEDLMAAGKLTHQPVLTVRPGEDAHIVMGEEEVRMLKVVLRSNQSGSHYSANLSLKEKDRGDWQGISFALPNTEMGKEFFATNEIATWRLLLSVKAQKIPQTELARHLKKQEGAN